MIGMVKRNRSTTFLLFPMLSNVGHPENIELRKYYNFKIVRLQ